MTKINLDISANHLGKSWANEKWRSGETWVLLLQELCQALLRSAMVPSRQISQLPQSHKHRSEIYQLVLRATQENVIQPRSTELRLELSGFPSGPVVET